MKDCPKLGTLASIAEEREARSQVIECVGSVQLMNAVKGNEGLVDFSVAPMDDFKIVIGLDLQRKANIIPMPYYDVVCVRRKGLHAWFLQSLKLEDH
ncbi:hypothetical protein PIB30_113284 [Stylosanthes scabra]|uniref:Uncharacterized protein n=1 Tax=Stylosanthes scabra TaxID=79078 RepID=A0ABU6U091_9FABA|nr:hypothetical protein [Stylosanthes scabra]